MEGDDGVMDYRVWVGVQAKVRLPLTNKVQWEKIWGCVSSHIPFLGYDPHVNSLRTYECDPVFKVTARRGSLLSLLTSATGCWNLNFLHRFCDVGCKFHVWHE